MLKSDLQPIRFQNAEDLKNFLSSPKYKKRLANLFDEEGFDDEILITNTGMIYAIDCFAKMISTTQKLRFQLIDRDGQVVPLVNLQETNKKALEKYIQNKPFTTSNHPFLFSGSFICKHKDLPDKIAQPLLIANNGETYWREDILALPDHAIEKSCIRFQNKQGKHFTLADIKNTNSIFKTLIHNKALAEILCTANITSYNTWEWSKVAHKCIIFRKRCLFPSHDTTRRYS